MGNVRCNFVAFLLIRYMFKNCHLLLAKVLKGSPRFHLGFMVFVLSAEK